MKNRNKAVLSLSMLLLLNPALSSMPVYASASSNADEEISVSDFQRNYEEVNIPDKNLKAKLLEQLYKGPNAKITKDDLKKITHLDISCENIKDLTGLEYCTNLENLNLSSNGTDYDLSIISNLTNLKLLYIGNNPLTDISPLKNLTNLYCLDISFTNLTDFSPLKDLPNLKTLFASGYDFNEYDYLDYVPNINSLISNSSNISDISKLASFTNLVHISLADNNISDISALANLKHLIQVNLSHNKISDISPLTALNDSINSNYLGIDISDQNITLDDCSSEDNFNLPLSIKDLNGNLITDIYNVSNGGVYDSTDNKITWNKEQAGSNVYYQFQYSYKSLKFSGTSSTNLVKTYSPDYYEEYALFYSQSISLPEEKFNGDYTLNIPVKFFNKPVSWISFILMILL